MIQITELTLGDIGVHEVIVGETWRVYVSFKYIVPENMTLTLRACPYRRVLGILNRVDGCCGQTELDLATTATPLLKEASVDISFRPDSEGGIADGTYGLIAEIVGTDAEEHIDDCIIVSGNPPGIWEMVPALMIVMMTGMMMNVMEGT